MPNNNKPKYNPYVTSLYNSLKGYDDRFKQMSVDQFYTSIVQNDNKLDALYKGLTSVDNRFAKLGYNGFRKNLGLQTFPDDNRYNNPVDINVDMSDGAYSWEQQKTNDILVAAGLVPGTKQAQGQPTAQELFQPNSAVRDQTSTAGIEQDVQAKKGAQEHEEQVVQEIEELEKQAQEKLATSIVTLSKKLDLPPDLVVKMHKVNQVAGLYPSFLTGKVSPLEKIINENRDKEFVRRMLDPDAPRIENPDGTYSTHLMGTEVIDGKWIVFPYIVEEDGELKKFDETGDAIHYALEHNNYIDFGNDKESALKFGESKASMDWKFMSKFLQYGDEYAKISRNAMIKNGLTIDNPQVDADAPAPEIAQELQEKDEAEKKQEDQSYIRNSIASDDTLTENNAVAFADSFAGEASHLLNVTFGRVLRDLATVTGTESLARMANDIEDVGAAIKSKSTVATDDMMGDLATSSGALAFDIMASSALMPEIAATRVATITNGAVKTIPKFPLYLGLKRGFETEGGVTKKIIGVGKGFAEGLAYEAAGVTSKEVGRMAAILAGTSELVSKEGLPLVDVTAQALVNGTLFGGHSVITDPDIWNKGDINWELFRRRFGANFALGVGFHTKEIGKRLYLPKINESMYKYAHSSFWTSHPEFINQSMASKLTNKEMRKESVRLFVDATRETNPEKQAEMLMKSNLLNRMIMNRVIAEEVVSDPGLFKEMIKENVKDGHLSEVEGVYYEKKVDKVMDYYRRLLIENNPEKAKEFIEKEDLSKDAKKYYLKLIDNKLNPKERPFDLLPKKETIEIESESTYSLGKVYDDISIIEDRIKNAEYISEKELNTAKESILKELDRIEENKTINKEEKNRLIDELINTYDKLDNYEFETKTVVREVESETARRVSKTVTPKAEKTEPIKISEIPEGTEILVTGKDNPDEIKGRGKFTIEETPQGNRIGRLKFEGAKDIKDQIDKINKRLARFKNTESKKYKELQVEKEKLESLDPSQMLGDIDKISIKDWEVNFDDKGDPISMSINDKSGNRITIRDKKLATQELIRQIKENPIPIEVFDYEYEKVKNEFTEEVIKEKRENIPLSDYELLSIKDRLNQPKLEETQSKPIEEPVIKESKEISINEEDRGIGDNAKVDIHDPGSFIANIHRKRDKAIEKYKKEHHRTRRERFNEQWIDLSQNFKEKARKIDKDLGNRVADNFNLSLGTSAKNKMEFNQWLKDVVGVPQANLVPDISKKINAKVAQKRWLSPNEQNLLADYIDAMSNLEVLAQAKRENRKILQEGGGDEISYRKIIEGIDNKDQWVLDEYQLKDYDPKIIKERAERYSEHTQEIINELEREKLISPEAAEKFRTEKKHHFTRFYVSHFGKNSEGEEGVISNDVIKAIEDGSTGAKIVNLQMDMVHNITLKNQAIANTRWLRSLDELVKEHPDNEFFKKAVESEAYYKKIRDQKEKPNRIKEEIKNQEEKRSKLNDDIAKLENKEKLTAKERLRFNKLIEKLKGLDSKISELNDDLKASYDPAFVPVSFKAAPQGYTLYRFKDAEGKDAGIYIKNWLSEEIQRGNKSNLNTLSWWMGVPILKFMATNANPEFAVKNVPLDILHIFLSQNEYSSFLPTALVQIHKDMYKVARDVLLRKGEYTKAIEQGMGMEWLSQQFQVKNLELKEVTAGDRGLETLVDALSYVGTSSELLTRLALRKRAYENRIKKFKKKNGRDPNKEENELIEFEATSVARDYLDFSQKGSVAAKIDAVIPYFNPGIQVVRTTARGAGRDPWKFTFKALQFGMAGAGFMLASRGFLPNVSEEDRRWMNQYYTHGISDQIKARNFVFLLPRSYSFIDENGVEQGRYLKFPVDNSVQLLKGSVEHFVSKLLGLPIGSYWNRQRFIEATSLIKNVTDISSTPPTASFALALFGNFDTFTMKTIWNKRNLKDLSRRFTPGVTPPRFIELGKLGLSPEGARVAFGKFLTHNNLYGTAMGELTDLAVTALDRQLVNDTKNSSAEIFINTPGLRRFLGRTYLSTNGYSIEKDVQDLVDNDWSLDYIKRFIKEAKDVSSARKKWLYKEAEKAKKDKEYHISTSDDKNNLRKDEEDQIRTMYIKGHSADEIKKYFNRKDSSGRHVVSNSEYSWIIKKINQLEKVYIKKESK